MRIFANVAVQLFIAVIRNGQGFDLTSWLTHVVAGSTEKVTVLLRNTTQHEARYCVNVDMQGNGRREEVEANWGVMNGTTYGPTEGQANLVVTGQHIDVLLRPGSWVRLDLWVTWASANAPRPTLVGYTPGLNPEVSTLQHNPPAVSLPPVGGAATPPAGGGPAPMPSPTAGP